MYPAEKNYIAQVKDTLSKHREPVEMVEELAKIEKPPTDGLFSLNARALMNCIDDLDDEYNDTIGVLESEEWDAAEQKVARDILTKVEIILADIENHNWYEWASSFELAYSRLIGDDYDYEMIWQPVDPVAFGDTETQRSELLAKTPKSHPEKPEYKLEDIRIKTGIIDSRHKPVNVMWNSINPAY